MKNEGGNGKTPRRKTTRRTSDDAVENIARNTNTNSNQVPVNPESSTRFNLGSLRDGVSGLFRRIQGQPNENSNLSLDSSTHHRKPKPKGEGRMVTGSRALTKANCLEMAENREREERRLKRRRRSSRTKRHERRGRDDRNVEYFSGRHLEERRSRIPRETWSRELKGQTQDHSQVPEHAPYGDTGTCDPASKEELMLQRSSEGQIIPTSEGEIKSIDREKISEGEIPLPPGKPSEGEVILIRSKHVKKHHQVDQDTIATQDGPKRRKKRRREEPKLKLKTKHLENANEDGEREKHSRRLKTSTATRERHGQEREHDEGTVWVSAKKRHEHQHHRRNSTKNIVEEHVDSKKKIHTRVGVSSAQQLQVVSSESSVNLDIKTKKPSQTLEEPSPPDCLQDFKNRMDFYLRTPSEILAETQQTIEDGVLSHSHSMSGKKPPSRLVLIPTRPHEIGFEPRKPKPSLPTAPTLNLEVSQDRGRELRWQPIETCTTSTSSIVKTKTKPEMLLALFKTLFLQGTKKFKSTKELDPAAYERMKAARKMKGPFWRVDLFENNRAKNKAANNTYAITFGCGFKKSPIRKREVKLMDNILNLAKSTKSSKLFRKNKSGEKNEQSRLKKHGDSFGDEYGFVNLPDLYDYRRSNTNSSHNRNRNHNRKCADPKMDYVQHVLTRPIAFNASKITADPLNIEVPKVLDFSHLINPNKPSSTPQFQSPYIDLINDYNNSSNFDISSITPYSTSSPSLPRKTNTSYLKPNSPMTFLLEDSSKVSHKTQVLLQASRVTSASQLSFPVNSLSSLKTQAQDQFFDDNTLDKIYTPKTDFTRQFASLLPSYNHDQHFGNFEQYF